MLGNTMEVLPPVSFIAGLALYPIGGYLFFMGSRQAINQAESRAARIIKPRIKNESAERIADSQAHNIDAHGSVDEQVRGLRKQEHEIATLGGESLRAASPAEPGLVLDFEEEEPRESGFNISNDVSFPIEVQTSDSLADQIMKLQKLQQNGIITAEEMAVAKAKLLS